VRDRTLAPMIPAGSIVQIDIQKRAISSRRDWTHEFQRPIYFLVTREGHVCGLCELDRYSDWLTLIPHPLSPTSSRRWRYRKEIKTIGRVTVVAVRLSRFFQTICSVFLLTQRLKRGGQIAMRHRPLQRHRSLA
jgi:hypothetical protein